MKLVVMNDEGWPGIDRAAQMLRDGCSSLDVVEESIRLTEADARVKTVSYGSAPNALGVMQLDASFMNGDTLETGAVGAIEETLHPISVAREMSKRLPHVLLVGAGATRFARECGFQKENILSPEAKANYEQWRSTKFRDPLVQIFAPQNGDGCHGTVVCFVCDSQGSFAGGVSTSGWDYKYPGRLGDSPIIGAGLYVDSRYGAAACTRCGESALRTCLARSVVLYMKMGASVKDAVLEGMQDLKALKNGYQGQVVIHASDKHGQHFVARRLKEKAESSYLIFTEGMSQPEKNLVEYFG